MSGEQVWVIITLIYALVLVHDFLVGDKDDK